MHRGSPERRAAVQKRPRKDLTQFNIRDPLQDIIDRQLSSQPWSGCICVEMQLHAAIDEKYSCCPHHVKLIRSLKKEGLTIEEIKEKTGYCDRQVRRLCKKN